MISLKLPYGHDARGFFWPASDQKRGELMSVKRGSPSDYESTYQCRPGRREGAIFLDSDFCYYADAPVELSMGMKSAMVQHFTRNGHGIFQAWDTAFSQTESSAYTVCVTGMFLPCNKYHRGEDPAVMGVCEAHFDVLVLEVFREKLDWGGLTKAFREQNEKWRPELIIVEKRASGISLFQAFNSGGMPIRGVDVAESKRARAIHGNAAGSVQGWFRQHRVLFPRTSPWLNAYRTELKDFTGDEGKMSDQVDATVHLITHAIQISAQTALLPSEWTPNRISELPELIYEQERQMIEHQLGATPDPRREMMIMIGGLDSMSVDPWASVCGRCEANLAGWCSVQRRRVIAFDSCAAFKLKGSTDEQDAYV